MYNGKLWENHHKIKEIFKKLGELAIGYEHEEFFKYEIPARKLTRELNSLLDKHRMLIDLSKKNKPQTQANPNMVRK